MVDFNARKSNVYFDGVKTLVTRVVKKVHKTSINVANMFVNLLQRKQHNESNITLCIN